MICEKLCRTQSTIDRFHILKPETKWTLFSPEKPTDLFTLAVLFRFFITTAKGL